MAREEEGLSEAQTLAVEEIDDYLRDLNSILERAGHDDACISPIGGLIGDFSPADIQSQIDSKRSELESVRDSISNMEEVDSEDFEIINEKISEIDEFLNTILETVF